MARVTFSETERTEAQDKKQVLYAFSVDGRECPDCADKLSLRAGLLPADKAEELGNMVRKAGETK